MLTAAQWEARKGECGGAGKRRNNFDVRKVRCYNCQDYGHYAKDCTVPRKEQAHLATVDADDKPVLL
ncbi:lectin receptor kinase [Hordeum vulgare]|nr:lectin receptor kinase [Hordeum vulgare]